jgi:hypothetical protein|tara:strand:- start:762 stop:3173 length:2412 start_codon:yes stop_codon:yes gene_type:complete
MAINIQEILHPSDSDSIKFSKINYNFDQLVVNGGGPEGPKGDIGLKGEPGNTGIVGPKGEQGEKGESGETTSPWKNIAIDLDPLDSRDNLTILKPKPDTDKATPVIWIGDSSFFNVDSDSTVFDGDTSLRSSLNVGRHYNLSSGQVEAEYMTFWHNANKKLKIDSEDVQGTSTVRWNITPAQPIVGNPEDIRLNINTHTIFTEPLKLDNKVPVNSPVIEESGMLRYNSSGNKFEGFIGGQWRPFCMDMGAGCGAGGGGTISISGGNLNLNPDGTLVGTLPTFQFSNWSGNVSVNAAGTVGIAYGNATLVTTDPVGPVAANTTAGTNSITFTVTVTVPSGYANAGSTIVDSFTATQPTSYVAPNVETFILNLNEGNSGSSWDVASATLIVANSNGATQNSFNPNAGGGTLSVDSLASTQIQIELIGNADSNLAFTADPFTITNAGGLSKTIISQQLSNNNEDAQLIFNVTLPGSGGTTNFTFEATTVSTQVSGTYNYHYGSTNVGACDSQSANYGGGVTGQSVTWNTGASNAAKLSAAQTAAGYHHVASSQYSGNGWISIVGIFENGTTIGVFADEAVQIGSSGGWVNPPSTCGSGGTGQQGKQGGNQGSPGYAPAAISYVTNPVTTSPHDVVEYSPIDVVVTTSNFANTPTLAYTVSNSTYFTVAPTGNTFNVAYQGQNQTQSGWIEITATGTDNGGNSVTVSTGQIALQGIAFSGGNNYSDRRLKNNINLIGTSDSGINIYTFEYKDCRYGCGLFEGVMSDEVPAEAVSVDSEGYDVVNYDLIDVEFKKIEDYSLYEGRGEV